jgi:integrase
MNPTVSSSAAAPTRQQSVFAGLDVCREAGLWLPAGAARPVFEDQVWDFTAVIGLPVQMPLANRRFDFGAILDSRWRLVARELLLALLAPRHPAVAPLPRACRTALHLRTAKGRLDELTRWLNWLTRRGVTGLAQVDDDCCAAYLAHRRHVLDEHGVVVGDRSPVTRRGAAQVVVDLLNYGELFTTDRLDPSLRPWAGASPSAVAQMRSGREENKTPPVADVVLQPLLAAALHLVNTLGPHTAALATQLRGTATMRSRTRPSERAPHKDPLIHLPPVLDRHRAQHDPLPELMEFIVRKRLRNGWDHDDPLLRVNLDALAREAGYWHFDARWLPGLRPQIEAALAQEGTAKAFGHDADTVPRADRDEPVPWTLPLHRDEADALVGIVRTAAIIVILAVSGMRSSEVMELRVGARRPPTELGPGLVRHRLASRVVKGQPLGGLEDEWVVIEPVIRAVELAEQLHDDPRDEALLFGRFAFDVRYQWFRNWVNGPAGDRLGLAPIPVENPVTPRMLRRTLAIELAYRPNGLLATKIHLKHVSVATTEGYASRPGGAQGELLAEINRHENERNLDLVWEQFRNYQQGVMPAGPGARELTAFFAQIDAGLDPETAAAPKIQHSDREVLNLLSKRAKTLHLATANYCWFTDPSRALCLKLAGTTTADRPLVGMCDSARCPQATHHPCHRPVWAATAVTIKTFLDDLGPTRKTERTRLHDDLTRAQRVLAEIDAATRGADKDR